MKKHISLFLVSVAVLGLTIGLAKAVDIKTYQGSITSINYNDATFILSSSPTVKVVTNNNTNISFKSGATTATKPFSNLKTGMVVTVIGIPSISLSSNPATIVAASEIKATGALTTTTKPLPTTNSAPISSVTTHNECRNGRCYKISGSGSNQCKVDSECQSSSSTSDIDTQSNIPNETLIKQLQEQLAALIAQLQGLSNQQKQNINYTCNSSYQCVVIPETAGTVYSSLADCQYYCKANQTYNLRDKGPAGGIIFYDKGYDSDGWRYLEAALTDQNISPFDQSVGRTWGCDGTDIPGADGTAIGTGHQNTHDMIVTGCTNISEVLPDSPMGGYRDWFLPSKDELNQMYVNLQPYGVGNFTDGGYWSSSEHNTYGAWYQPDYRIQVNLVKSSTKHVRAIRAFGTSSVNKPPVIDSATGPTQLKVNESGTWTIKAHDPENGYLSYSVKWGDEAIYFAPQSSDFASKQTTTFTHTYSKVGTYTVEFTVTDDQKQTAKSTMTIRVTETFVAKPDLIISDVHLSIMDPAPRAGDAYAYFDIDVKNQGTGSLVYNNDIGKLGVDCTLNGYPEASYSSMGSNPNYVLGVSWSSITLLPGETKSMRRLTTIANSPLLKTLGMKDIYCKVNTYNEIEESNINNNTYKYSIYVAQAASVSCSDTDNGNDIYKKGTITIKDSIGNQKSYTDYCQNTSYVQEYVCATDLTNKTIDNAYSLGNVYCPNGCKDGACIRNACVGENQSLNGLFLYTTSCCSGLTWISTSSVYTGSSFLYGTCLNAGSGGYCTYCGDGVCKSPENQCNCPKDCSGPVPSIKVISPISGETLQDGATYKIKWDASNLPSNAQIYITLIRSDLEPNSPLNMYIASLPVTQREYIWKINSRGFVYKNLLSPFAKFFGIKTADAAEKYSYQIMVWAGWQATSSENKSVRGYSGWFDINPINYNQCSVKLEARPNSGQAPLNGVDLWATVSGTATGTIGHKFDCNNDGVYELTVDGAAEIGANEIYHAVGFCNYQNPGIYTAKVKTTRGTTNCGEGTAIINVSSHINVSSQIDSSYCQSKGGTWEQFTDGCVDSCSKVSNPNLSCLQALTYGCDCGSSKCWDTTTKNCISNSSIVIKYSCNSSYQCATNISGSYSTLSACQANCVNPANVGCSLTKTAYVSGETPSLTVTGSHPWGATSFMLKKDGVIKCVDQLVDTGISKVVFGGNCMPAVAKGTYGYGTFEASGVYSGDPMWNCSFRYATATTSFESDTTSLKAQLLDLVRSLLEYIQNQ